MTQVRIEGDGHDAVSYIEPGATLGPVNAYLWENGGYLTPLGVCPKVGYGGHAIGGGAGMLAGLFGIAADNLLEVEVVDAKGNVVTASAETNPDLFWAMRGSWPGYIAILTRAKVKLYKASKLNITLVQVQYSVENFTTAFSATQDFRNWLQANDSGAFLELAMASDTYNGTLRAMQPGISITTAQIQDSKYNPVANVEFLKAIEKYFPAPGSIVTTLNPSYIEAVAMVPYVNAILPDPSTGEFVEIATMQKFFGDLAQPNETAILDFLKLLTKDVAAPRYFKAKGFFTRKMVSRAELDPVQTLVNEMPQKNFWMLAIAQLGKVLEPSRNDTAYVHRDSIFDVMLQYEGSQDPSEVTPGIKYLYDLYDEIKFMDSGESYQNYPDMDVGENYLDRYYKENFEKLVEQKVKWDPNNYFVSKLSLPVTIKQEL